YPARSWRNTGPGRRNYGGRAYLRYGITSDWHLQFCCRSLVVSTDPQLITVLGATGSIGGSTLDVISRHPDRYKVFALTADRRWQLLATQCLVHQPRYAVLKDYAAALELEAELRRQGCPTEVLQGDEALELVAAHDQVDTVMAAIVGAAG